MDDFFGNCKFDIKSNPTLFAEIPDNITAIIKNEDGSKLLNLRFRFDGIGRNIRNASIKFAILNYNVNDALGLSKVDTSLELDNLRVNNLPIEIGRLEEEQNFYSVGPLFNNKT